MDWNGSDIRDVTLKSQCSFVFTCNVTVSDIGDYKSINADVMIAFFCNNQ